CPILHRLIIHLHDDMLDDRWSNALIGEGKPNRAVAVIELQNRPDRSTHLLALHVSGVTGNAQRTESDKGRDDRVISTGAARRLCRQAQAQSGGCNRGSFARRATRDFRYVLEHSLSRLRWRP